MAKYLSISTSNDGVLQAPVGVGMMAELTGANEVRLYLGSTVTHHIKLTCTGANQAFIDNINAALKSAAETSWTNAIEAVTVPAGVVVTDYAMTVFS
jgi:hypothetical protein